MVKVSVNPWWHRKLSLLQYQRGLSYLRGMAYQQAIAAFAQAMKCHPRPGDVLVMRGLAYSKLGQAAAAFSDYNQALSLNPNHGRALAQRGLLHESQGNLDAAQADWERAIALGIQDAEIYYRQGLKALDRHDSETAQANFDQAIALNPNLAEAYFQRGNLHYSLGQTEAAVRDWELAVCNDFGQDDAKLKLEAVRETEATHYLTQQIQSALSNDELTITVYRTLRNRIPLLEVVVERELGVGVNYTQVAEQVRSALVPLELHDISHFELTGRVQGSRFQDWQRRYGLYDQEPCPPRYWRLALMMLILSPPFGMSALLCSYQVESFYKKGKYPQAQQASQFTKLLCYSGAGLSALVLLLTTGSMTLVKLHPALQQGLQQNRQDQPATTQDTDVNGSATPETSDFQKCLTQESRARCLLYRKKVPTVPTENP